MDLKPFNTIFPREIVKLILSFVNNHFHGVLVTCKLWNQIGTTIFDPSTNDNAAIKLACKTNDLKRVKSLLLDSRVDPSSNFNEPLQIACREGFVEVIKELLKHEAVDPTIGIPSNLASRNILKFCCENNYIESTRALLEDPRMNPAYISAYGNWEITEILFRDPRSSASFSYGYAKYIENNGTSDLPMRGVLANPTLALQHKQEALRAFCRKGKLDFVKQLLNDPHVDPTLPDVDTLETAVSWASKNGFTEIQQLLEEFLQKKEINQISS